MKTYATLTGLIIGDSLGGPFEFLTNKEIQKAIDDKRWNGEFLENTIWENPLKPGQYTDDGKMAFALADCLIKYGRYDEKIVAKNYVDWLESGDLRGIGNQTIKAIRNIINGKSLTKCGAIDNAGQKFDYCGNGALMRIAPLILFYKGTGHDGNLAVERDAVLTHNHKDAIAANYALRTIISALIDVEFGFATYISDTIKVMLDVMVEGNVKEILKLVFKDYMDNWNNWDAINIEKIISFGTEGTAHETLATAILCFLASNSFEDAIMKAVLVGGDTDTRAAITGAMAGTYYGLGNIPGKYLDNVEDGCKAIAYDMILSKGFRKYNGIFGGLI